MTGKNQQIQIMRGLAITIVLIRHASAQVNTDVLLDAVEDIIICFHMLVFFLITGFLFQRGLSKYLQKGKEQFIIGKAKHLMFSVFVLDSIAVDGCPNRLFGEFKCT